MLSKIKNRIRLILFALALCKGFVSFGQFDIPKKPSLQTSVYDYINLLNSNEKKLLENKLIRYSDTTSTQIVVAIISSTKGENINYLGAQWGQKWGIGQEKEDNGILILLAKDDRKIAISTGYGIESVLTDALSKRIIENEIIPEFRSDNYPRGLDKGVDAVFKVLTGTYQNTNTAQKFSPGIIMGILGLIIFILFIIIIVIAPKIGGGSNKGGGKGKSAGTNIWDVIILSNMGRGNYGSSSGGGFGGGGSFGGGFSGGFGGGGFGGGGASGGW